MTYASRHKSAQQRSVVFISYARSDGEAFAHRLRQQLEKQNIKPWQDRVGMEGGRDWWLQITNALDNVEFMALVVTPNALKSEIVRKEWRYARRQGVCIYPIKCAPNLNFESLPRWMRDQHFYDLGSLEDDSFGPEWRKFLNDLNKTPDVRRAPSAMNYIKEQFEEIGITALDNERVSVARTMETSLRELTEEEGARFAELAVFDLNIPIPTATLELYWALTGNFSKIKTKRFCDRLHDLSFVYYSDTKYFSILIPQAIHRFLQDQHKNEITKFRDNLLTCLVEF